MPNRANPGTAQNMCRTVIIRYDVVLPGQNFVFAPCAAHRDFTFREEDRYEEDTLYHFGEGYGDP